MKSERRGRERVKKRKEVVAFKLSAGLCFPCMKEGGGECLSCINGQQQVLRFLALQTTYENEKDMILKTA